MKTKFLPLFVAIIVCTSMAPRVLAQSWSSDLKWDTVEDVMQSILIIIFGSEVPEDWVTPRGFLQYLIFPWLATFAVMYGILTELKLFRTAKSAKTTIALMMSLVAGVGTLRLMRAFLVANSIWGTVLFGLALFVGIALWFYGNMREAWGDATKMMYNERLELRDLIAKEDDIYSNPGRYGEPGKALLEEIKKRKDEILKRQREAKDGAR